MNVRIKAETDTTVTIEWDAVPGQEGYVATIDSSEILGDGKRHFSGSKTVRTTKFAKVQDGAPHAYGVNVLGVKEQGSVVVGDTEPPPPPPAAGAEWYRVFDPPAGMQVMDFHNVPRGRLYLDVRNGDQGRRHIKNLRIDGASPECLKLGISAYLENFRLTGANGINHQGINLQAGQTYFRGVYGLIDDIGQPGDKFSHCAYVGPGWSDTAFGSVWFKSSSGETFQWYDNPEGRHLLVHCTVGVSSGQEGLVGWDEQVSPDDVMEVWNSVIVDDIQHDSGNLRLRGLCCVTGDLPSSVDTTGATVIREDPQLDSRGVPRNPKLRVTDPTHKAWLPPLAWDGQPHSGMAGAA